ERDATEKQIPPSPPPHERCNNPPSDQCDERGTSMPVKVNSLDHLVINVSDVARSAEWYRKILGMEVRTFSAGAGGKPRTALFFGNQRINVRPQGADKVEWFTGDHVAAGSDDLCFLTSSTPDEVVAHLKANGIAIEA